MRYESLGGNAMPRFGGPGTFMRLPEKPDAQGLDVGIVGVPLDIGTSFRSGAHHAPKAIRAESCLIRPYNMATRAAPFDSLTIADVGDVPLNPFSLEKSVGIIQADVAERIVRHGAAPIAIGGDHTITLPLLRALTKRTGPVGLVHVDAHADVNDRHFGEPVTHGTTFRRCLEEGLIEGRRVVQIGLRATGYTAEDFDWPRKQGFRVVQAEECWHRSLTPLMAEVREQVKCGPVYLTFDIDGLDPAYAMGNGSPEIGGLTTPQALEIIRGCRGLDMVGADLVEVSPPFEANRNTCLTAANLLYEMLCVLPGVTYRN
ncbi:MAG: agmatinase [Alphaproteobacteria bacterium]